MHDGGQDRLVTIREDLALNVREWQAQHGQHGQHGQHERSGAEAAGPPALLVHGLASNARLWDGVAIELAQRGHRVVAVDLRGHGRSTKPVGGYDLTTVTDDLVALIDRLGLEGAMVAGQSWGGNVVLELGWRRPELVAAVACVDGGFIELADRFPVWEECARQLAPPNLEGMPASRMEAAMRAAHPGWPAAGIAGAMANFEILADGTIRPWLRRDHHLAVLHGLWQHRPSDRYPQMRVPVLLVAADTGDVAWTADKQAAVDRAVAALPVGAARWFSPADHDVHAQFPAEVAAVLSEWAGRVGAVDPGSAATVAPVAPDAPNEGVAR